MCKSNPEYWDYKNPRSAQEYIRNNYRRGVRRALNAETFIWRLFVGAATFFVCAAAMALLVG